MKFEIPKTGHLYVVSNRLPVVLHESNDHLTVTPGMGGLVTALAPVLKNRGGTWIGWPGPAHSKESKVRKEIANASHGFKYDPVFLTDEEVSLYYDGFSNEILWPLFHDLQGRCNFNPDYWRSYQDVNGKFADVISNQIKENDFIWVNDYHLLLLGDELNKRGVKAKTGFFLHIPFPPMDIFIKLPWRYEILSALMKYDLIGFQTQRDKRNFIQCLRAVLQDVDIRSKGPIHICREDDSEVRIGSFPISIDFDEFLSMASSEEVSERAWLMHENFPEQKLIFSLDRLDYTKGIPQRLRAIRTFLQNYPEYHKKVCFIQVVVPSRTDVPKYQQLKSEIDRLVGEINSKFTKEGWIPIYHLYRSISREELLTYYRTSEVALITPIKDGMNLVSKEYIASNIEEKGTLILSEFAGSAAQLQDDAILVNPYDIEGIANALNTALSMPLEERKKRMQNMRRIVKRYDIFWWTNMLFRAAFGIRLDDLPIIPEYIPQPEG